MTTTTTVRPLSIPAAPAVVFPALSLIVNATLRSPGERRLWVPVAIMILASSLVAATS